jgi:hypothetical protein
MTEEAPLPICVFCGLPIDRWYISHKATWVIPRGGGAAHEDCYVPRMKEDTQAQERQMGMSFDDGEAA